MASAKGSRQLAAVMFTDMVGYTALVQRDEKLGYQLLEEQRKLVRARLPQFGGREVETVGDAFLIEFGSALMALRCGLSLHQRCAARLREQPGAEPLILRIGLHLGDVERPGKQIFGDTVNIAARLQDLSPKGGIAISAQVYHQVNNKLDLPYLAIGATALKNITHPVEVFTLDASAVQAAPETLASSQSVISAQTRPRFGWPLRIGALLAVLALIIALALVLNSPQRESSNTPAITPSVAILPLSNLSKDADDGYLAGGIQDAVITNLTRIRNLKVIASSSVSDYAPAPTDVRSIGRELGVGAVIKGSVERSGKLLRVKLQLFDTSNNNRRWSRSYEKPLDDSYALSSEISQQIAQQLHAPITPTEKQAIEDIPTANPEAYAACQKALYVSNTGATDSAARERVIALYQRAIELDPSFLQPYAGLVVEKINAFIFGIDTDPKRLEEVRANVQQLQKLDPHSEWTRLARGYFYSQILHDDARAADEARAGLLKVPGDSNFHLLLAIALSHQDLMGEAIENFNRARELAPKDVATTYDLSDAYSLSHNYRASLPIIDDVIRMVPKETAFADARAYQQLGASEDLGAFLTTLLSLSELPGLNPFLRLTEKMSLATIGGRYDDTLAFVRQLPESIVWEQGYGTVPRGLVEANLLWVKGDTAAAREMFRSNLPLLLAARHQASDDTVMHAWMALTYAILGERNAALSEAHLVEESIGYRQPSHRQTFATLLGQTYLALGDKDEALNQIELMLHRSSYASAAYVRHDAIWRALRDHPRFQSLTHTATGESGRT